MTTTQATLRNEHNCSRFLELVGKSVQRFEAAILCLVLMGHHFHSVAQTHRITGVCGRTEAANAITVVFGALSARLDAGDFKEPYR